MVKGQRYFLTAKLTKEEFRMVYQMVKEPRKYRIKAFTSETMSMANLMVKENLHTSTALHTQGNG